MLEEHYVQRRAGNLQLLRAQTGRATRDEALRRRPCAGRRSTLGHLLRPLEKRGLVTLDVSEEDRRSPAIALTPAGTALMKKAHPLSSKARPRFQSYFRP